MAEREILFRGKRVDNGEWVYGYYLKDIGSCIKEKPSAISTQTHLVLLETVGQYTGLIDKNGTKIFEGDICRFKRFNDAYVGQIVFNVKTASFIMWYSSTVGAYGEKATHKMLLSVCDEIEVIGNIHDNPEILKNTNP